jgi:putative addiction module killer protein
MLDVLEYLDEKGHSPYGKWFANLDRQAALKVSTAVTRLSLGNISKLEAVGEGVHELKIDFGPGYRVYLGKDGMRLVILLAGGTKKRQNTDIKNAKGYWANYKKRKNQE